MKIAIAADGDTLQDLVPARFEGSPFLLIVETDDGSYEVFKNPEVRGGAGLAMISGSIEKPAFQELMIAQVTRYMGADCRASDALQLMEANRLDFIRVPKGEVWTPHERDGSGSQCGNHHE